jgi:2-methylcitrate dehydratase PrpD
MTAPAAVDRLAHFAATAAPPPEARAMAASAFLDTVGVTLAGVSEPASRIVREIVAAEEPGACAILGTPLRASVSGAAFANGTAAHALDFDDMCFVSLAHPSAPLVSAALAAAEIAGAPGRAALDAYVAGFEIEARLGRVMNPRHYERGWHCTSTLGTIGAAAAVGRLLGLDRTAVAHALAIAASEASGLKENFGSMVKPLHAGLAARNGVLAARLAQAGMTASRQAFEGPQGFLRAFDSAGDALAEAIADLGARWEILETGITVKLYPSCAGTHPTIDTVLDLRREHGFTGADVERIDVDVDSIAPTILMYPRPRSGLEAKFSMPFCAAAAALYGRIGIDTFEDAVVANPDLDALIPRVTMRVDPSFDGRAPALTQARVRVVLRGGRVLERDARGARGYPERPATSDDLAAKFLACATRAVPEAAAQRALERLRGIERLADVRTLTGDLMPSARARVSTP